MTAIHVRDILKQIYGFAILHGEKVANPADEVGPASIATFVPKDRSLSPSEIRVMLKQLEHIATLPKIRLGMRLYLLTMVRKSELQDAVWDEVDFENAVWTIPKERMKRSKAHNVYLSRQVLDIMIALKTCAGNSRYLLPSRYGADAPMSRATFNRVTYAVVERAKTEGLPLEPFTIHDLRRTGSTLLNELGFNSDWIEKCLAHEDGRSSRGVYNKAEYEVQRRHMMQEWSDIVDAWVDGKKYGPSLIPPSDVQGEPLMHSPEQALDSGLFHVNVSTPRQYTRIELIAALRSPYATMEDTDGGHRHLLYAFIDETDKTLLARIAEGTEISWANLWRAAVQLDVATAKRFRCAQGRVRRPASRISSEQLDTRALSFRAFGEERGNFCIKGFGGGGGTECARPGPALLRHVVHCGLVLRIENPANRHHVFLYRPIHDKRVFTVARVIAHPEGAYHNRGLAHVHAVQKRLLPDRSAHSTPQWHDDGTRRPHQTDELGMRCPGSLWKHELHVRR